MTEKREDERDVDQPPAKRRIPPEEWILEPPNDFSDRMALVRKWPTPPQVKRETKSGPTDRKSGWVPAIALVEPPQIVCHASFE